MVLFASCRHMMFAERRDAVKGLHVMAAPTDEDAVPEGTDLWLETPFAAVVLEESRTTVCHSCWTALHTANCTISPVVCEGCSWAVYCSGEIEEEPSSPPSTCSSLDGCRKTHSRGSLHRLVCPYMGEVAAELGERYGLTENRIRLLL